MKLRNGVTYLMIVLLLMATMLLVPFRGGPAYAQQNAGSFVSKAAAYTVQNYNYVANVNSGSTGTGAYAITMVKGTVTLKSGAIIAPFNVNAPITIGNGAQQETVTPTAVSNCYAGAPINTCTITATFTYAHGKGAQVVSGTFGLQEAINDARAAGGGLVVIGPGSSPVTNAIIATAQAVSLVSIEDLRFGTPVFWEANPSSTALLAAPAVLTSQAACDATHSFCSDATVVGTWAASGSLFGCITYVDIIGGESPCSTTASFTNVTVKAIDVGAPAASAGAVGYAIYLSLSGGTYAAAYRVPITSSICTMTTLETVTPACAITNTSYGQVASTTGLSALFTGGAQIAATTVNTAMHFPVAGGISTAASNVGAPTAHTTFAYAPGSGIGSPGFQTRFTPFAAVATQATTVPGTMGSINLPPGFMNFLGKTIRITGKFTTTQPGATSEVFGVYWDADGTNTTTNPVIACNYTNTSTGTNAVWNGAFECLLTTTATGATGTLAAAGQLVMNLAAATTAGELYILPESATAVTGSVNLLSPQGSRLDIISTPTGSTQSATTLLSLNLEVL